VGTRYCWPSLFTRIPMSASSPRRRISRMTGSETPSACATVTRLTAGDRPEADRDTSDLLRRLLAVRATREGRRISSRPLTDARIRRVLAVASSALADLVPHTLPVNPAAGVKAKVRRVRPLLWTPPRVERWQQTGEIPGPVMVWTREQCGEFLDVIENERLYALYHLAAYYGPRRNELCNLTWADTDLAGGTIIGPSGGRNDH